MSLVLESQHQLTLTISHILHMDLISQLNHDILEPFTSIVIWDRDMRSTTSDKSWTQNSCKGD